MLGLRVSNHYDYFNILPSCYFYTITHVLGFLGISAAQIVHDINAMPKRQPRRFEQFVEELKTKREKWKQLQLMKMERLGDEEEESPAKQQGIVLKIVEWWKAEEKQPVSEFSKEIAESGAKWWKRTSRRIRQTVNDIQEVIHTTPDGIEGNSAADDSGQEVHNLVRKGNLFRRDSLDPNVASSFDVAVVLLGLNDIKEAFMPPMIHGANSSLNEGTKPTGGVLNSQLEKMFHALMGKMGKDNDADSTISTEGTQSITVPQKLHPPLVVVPELPVAPLEAFQLVPLCWLLLPLFRAMERNKKFLSSTFPNNVVFIKQPDLAWWSDAEKRHKSYKDDEEFIVKLTDIAQTAQTQVKQLMKRFYHPNNQKTGNKEESELVNGNGNQNLSESNAKESGVSVEGDQAVPSEQKSLYIAQDKIHPNDEGYDLFGQYIAEAVVRHWGRPQV